jgi:hypothetical protein
VTQTEAHNNLYIALHAEMVRVDALRLKLDFRQADHVLIEFLMRRAILHAQYSLQHQDPKDQRSPTSRARCSPGFGRLACAVLWRGFLRAIP